MPLFQHGLGDFEGDPVGTVYAIRLKPGTYAFSCVQISGTSRGRGSALTNPQFLFTILPGTISYIGNIHYVPLETDWFKCRIETMDKRDRDLPVFFQKYPNVKAEEIIFNLMKLE